MAGGRAAGLVLRSMASAYETQDVVFSWEGEDYSMTVAVPDDADGPPMPLIIQLHGYCLGGVRQENIQLGMLQVVDPSRFVLAMPDAPKVAEGCALCHIAINDPHAPMYEKLGARALTGPDVQCIGWDATDACCRAQHAGRNGGDVGYVLAAAAAAAAELNVDPSRVSVLGIANGGFLALRAACDAPESFSAVVAYAASAPPQCPAPGGGSVDVLLVHGTDDTVVPVEGGVGANNATFAGMEASAARVAAAFGCTTPTSQPDDFSLAPGDRELPLEVTATVVGEDCGARDASVRTWLVDGGRHFLPDATSREFFRERVVPELLATGSGSFASPPGAVGSF